MANQEVIETVKVKELENSTVAIVLAKDWFSKQDVFNSRILESDFIVCKWFDFKDGIKSNIEGKTTISICRFIEDAEVIFQRHIKILSK